MWTIVSFIVGALVLIVVALVGLDILWAWLDSRKDDDGRPR